LSCDRIQHRLDQRSSDALAMCVWSHHQTVDLGSGPRCGTEDFVQITRDEPVDLCCTQIVHRLVQ
jgi:hypothetical protein